ncbi:glycosyltransferase [Micromonospora echinofusca]|uniref:Glycosyltransferase family 2 protein n=1 Tax=Micromonospora echinofusca TaxID=47858 RepID=A0ABS3W0I6_MICEH|nr:glycosyltransferase family 2 protein [Micromonospora echinofusca]MBO4210124.1 glycosyltransferase family 2 protein [Micromonospora echinofusca]
MDPEPPYRRRPDRPADLSYVLPLRWSDDTGLDELTGYLRWLSRRAEVTVVDGSAAPLFARHARSWRPYVRHVPPDARLTFANGKVSGVTTGVRLARHEAVVIADDDVRYDDRALTRMRRLLDTADLVRPQNFFHPLPWHAAWDSGRTLLNRAFGADYPGTLGIRRSVFLAIGGYDGDVLFENLELIRTVGCAGGVELRAHDLFVRRVPPDARRFWSQRVRQAYDDLAQPARMLVFLGVVPAVLAALARRRPAALLVGAAGVVAAAEVGRRRAGATAVYPAHLPLLAPVWVLERAVCSWLALALRYGRGGVPYAGRRLRTAAHSRRQLRRAVVPH